MSIAYFRFRIIFALNILCISLAFGQAYPHTMFFYEDPEVIWQKVYEFDVPSDSMIDRMLQSTIIMFPNLLDTSILIGEIKDIRPDFTNLPSAAGSSYAAGTISGQCKIEFKENRYRVTIRNLAFHPKTTNWIKVDPGENKVLVTDEYYNIKSKKWKALNSPILPGFNQALLKLFDPASERLRQNSNW